MFWKKNLFSYIIWTIYLAGAGFCIVVLGRQAAASFGASELAGLLIGACGIVAAGILFTVLRLLSEKTGKLLERSPLGWNVVQAVILVCLLAGGLVFRVSHLEYAGETADYFGMAKVVEGGGLPGIVDGAESFYVQVLHFLYLFLGNKWEAGIWMQIVLQMAGGLLAYFAVRGLAGGVPALFVLGYLMLDPTCIAEGLVYSPTVLYQCVFLAGFLAVGRYLKKQAEGRMKTVYDTLLLIFTGVLTAFVCFLDVSGLALLALLGCVFSLYKDEKGKEEAWGRLSVNLPVLLLSFVGFFLAFLLLEAYAGGTSFVAVWTEKWGAYLQSVKTYRFWQVGSDWAAHFAVAVGLLLGTLGYLGEKDKERFSPWVLTAVVLCLLNVFGLGLCLPGLIWMCGAALAGIGLADGLTAEAAPEESEEAGESEKTEAENQHEGFEFLEIPLPMPKKHRKRVMDFAVQPSDEEMKFDYEVADDDDFDY